MHISGRNLKEMIKLAHQRLYNYGQIVETDTWQGKDDGFKFIELLFLGMESPMAQNKEESELLCNPLQPWCNEHFEERISGIPMNPPPSHEIWRTGTSDYLSNESVKFSHSYPERMWPKTILDSGVRYAIGDLNDIVTILKKDRYTRQAYLPIWFPEDLGAVLECERVPCTLGWHFIIRKFEGMDYLNISYPMRSMDAVRHFANDVYLVNLLGLWVANQLNAKVGMLNINVTSFHCFENDRYALGKLAK